jgi:hypothetical protein
MDPITASLILTSVAALAKQKADHEKAKKEAINEGLSTVGKGYQAGAQNQQNEIDKMMSVYSNAFGG